MDDGLSVDWVSLKDGLVLEDGTPMQHRQRQRQRCGSLDSAHTTIHSSWIGIGIGIGKGIGVGIGIVRVDIRWEWECSWERERREAGLS
jgi:hypothetical protein